MLDVDIDYEKNDFHLDVKFNFPSRVIGVFGNSGAGKSTFISILSGIIKPDHGYIKVAGVTVFDSVGKINLAPHKRKIGYVFQDSLLFPHLSVKANLLYGFKLNKTSEQRISFDHIIDLLGVETLLDRKPMTLSGGERQRIAIGRALLAQPQMLLMDEPLASLDLQRKLEILAYIERLRDEINIPIVYVSHSIAEISRLADTIMMMVDGKSVASGPLNDVINQLDFNLVDQYAACSILDATIVEHMDGLTHLAFSGGELWVPLFDKKIGATVRTRIMAKDVALSIHKPEGISTLNILKSTIVSINAQNDIHADIRLTVGDFKLSARLTNRSIRLMDLRAGREVYALVKSVSFEEMI